MKKTSILQCPGMVCSPPVVSKCLGEAHRRLELFTLLHYLHTCHFLSLLGGEAKSSNFMMFYEGKKSMSICWSRKGAQAN